MARKTAPRVAVVGAGIAGLGTAWELVRRGFDVALIERRERAGGRLVSDRFEGFSFEPFGGLLSSADAALLDWIGELGLRDELLPLRPVVMAQARAGRVREIGGRSVLDVARIPGVAPHQAARVLRLPRLLKRYERHLAPDQPERAAPLDDRSVADFARLYFGGSVLEHWIAPLVTGPCLADEGEASRALFLRRFAAQRDALFGLPRAPLAELPEAAAARLPTHLGVEVENLTAHGGAVDVGVRQRGRRRRLTFDAVVIAAGADATARIAGPALAPAERDFFGRVRHAPGLFLDVALQRPLSPHPQLVQVPRGEDSAIETVLLEPGVRGGRVPERAGLASLCAGSAWAERRAGVPNEAIQKELLQALEALLPCRGAVRFARLARTPRARPRFDVGHYREIERFERVQRDRRAAGRRLYFAGDYLMDPSWNGALLSGRRAAHRVADDLAAA